MPDKPVEVLILEDDPDYLLLLKKFIAAFKRGDMRLSAAGKLSEAVDLLNKKRFDLLLSDLNLPDSGGLATFRGLQAAAPQTPIIILTGLDDETMALQAVREGAQDYLIKDEVNAGVLMRATVYAMERNKLLQERLNLINKLTAALSSVKTLTGLLPICAGCKKIRNDNGYWEQVEMYLKEHSDMEFTHGFCPDCIKKLYPELSEEIKNRPR
ncbi:MAG: hypothetical protein A2X28_05395 [Elusimicrobia bacterium GWA2_56_46]|nr:MAG: hypothetical protein A2X28_05395 [Elusimicrobia bacterium GWA2_56_46]OGR55703.1 MAG: hypothetical protein A2X39_00015 [Elusimicrobia bacterium GWC2_56_31]HBB67485.1 hypothetical protein [Elusimicrobiota bacterium]HBW23179.1 hypothetical protein [Elusimicrobiota bacterium]